MAKKSDLQEEIDLKGSRLKKLTIRNFRCIGKEGISIELDRIVVLVGPNNVGKSTILRAYQYVMDNRSISEGDLFNGKIDLENPPTIELETWIGDEKPGQDWLLIDGDSQEEYIKESWEWGSDNKPIRKGFHAGDNKWSNKVPWGAPNVAKARRPKPHRVEVFASPQEQVTQVAKLLVEWIKEGMSNSTIKESEEEKSAFGRIKKVYQEVHDDLVLETKERVEQAEIAITSLVSKVFPNYKVQFAVSPNMNPEKIFESLLTNPTIKMGLDGGYLANVQDQGSGAQRTLLWAALKLLAEESKGGKKNTKNTSKKGDEKEDEIEREAKRPNVLLIDEPEICLHPSAVREACKTLYDLAEGETGWQVMVTTHSPVFIDISRDNTTVVRVQREENGLISCATIFRPNKAKLTKDDKENIKLQNLWDPYFAEFFFGGKTILVEGDTEYLAFKTIINERPNDFKDVHIIRARGKAILVTLMKVLNHFGQVYAVLHDADKPLTEKSTTNPMWTINQNIQDIAMKSVMKIRLVAAIKDFETAIFMQESKSDKPFSAWKKMKDSPIHMGEVAVLLTALIDHEKVVPNRFLEWNNLEELKSAVEDCNHLN